MRIGSRVNVMIPHQLGGSVRRLPQPPTLDNGAILGMILCQVCSSVSQLVHLLLREELCLVHQLKPLPGPSEDGLEDDAVLEDQGAVLVVLLGVDAQLHEVLGGRDSEDETLHGAVEDKPSGGRTCPHTSPLQSSSESSQCPPAS